MKTATGKSSSDIRFAVPFRPKVCGRFFRPRSMNEEHLFWRPGFSFRFQRHSPTTAVRPHCRSVEGKSPSIPVFHSAHMKYVRDTQGPSKYHNSSSGPSIDSFQGKEIESLSSTVRPDHLSHALLISHHTRGEKVPEHVMRETARNEAIREKRREIEEMYRQDCDTFGVVVKMLIAKDPSLEQTIQASFRENLQDIGLRCVGAMQRFIEEYDFAHPCPLTSPPYSKT